MNTLISKLLTPTNLKRLAIRFAKKIIIVPHSDLKQDASSSLGTSWASLGNDPQFIIHPARSAFGRRFKRGWYMFRIRISERNHESQLAKVYIQYRSGEVEVKNIPWTSQKFVNRLFYLRETVSHIRFDPCENETQFILQTCLLIKVPSFLAKKTALERIKRYHFEGRSHSELKHALESKSKSGITTQAAIIAMYDETFNSCPIGKSYTSWIKMVEPKLIHGARRQSLTEQTVGFSVVIPTYNTEPDLLKACLKSVMRQTYSNWEICIADDASSNPATIQVLQEVESQNREKVKVNYLKINGHISYCSNSALSIASKSHVILLDHDDLLPTYTLELFAKALVSNPRVRLLYGDEDKITRDGHRHQPHFKPDWNPDLLLSQNYICHPVVLERQLACSIGGFREGFEGSQDHDLLLRASQKLATDEIMHLPYILYHWRVIENSTAADSSAKSYTTEAGKKALQDFFRKSNKNVSVEAGSYSNTYRIRWPIPSPEPLVSLIIPTRDGYEILKQCLESIYEKTTYTRYEVIVVDNQSECQSTLKLLQKYENTHENFRVLKWDKPFNYSEINNYAVSKAKGEIVGLVNNDIEVISPEWLSEMVSHAIRPEIGCVGAKLYYPNDTIQHAGVILGVGGVAGHSHKYFDRRSPGYFSRLSLTQNVSAVTAACLIVRREIFDQVGGLNERDLKIAFNDVDFCLKVLSSGYRNIFTPWAELYHHESISRGEENTPQKVERFNSECAYMVSKWGHLLKSDAAYNPNLTMEREDFSIA